MPEERDERFVVHLPHMAISAIIALGVGLLTAFWSLADPRAEIKIIRDTYLTIREHAEYRDGVRSDLDRLRERDKDFMTRSEVETVWAIRARELEHLHEEIRALRDSARECKSK